MGKFAVGQQVRVVDNGFWRDAPIGTIGKIVRIDEDGSNYVDFDGYGKLYANDSRLESVTTKEEKPVSKFSVGNKVKVKALDDYEYGADEDYAGKVGVIEEIDDDPSAEVRFDDGNWEWYGFSEIELAEEKPVGLRAEQLIGRWAYRLAPAINSVGEPRFVAMLQGAKPKFEAPYFINSIDANGINGHGKDNCPWVLSPLFLDSNWAEWVEPKFKVGEKVHILGSKLVSGCRGAAGMNGVITDETSTNGGVQEGYKGETINVKMVDGRIWKVNLDAVVAYDPEKDKNKERELWLQAKERYTSIHEVLYELVLHGVCSDGSAKLEIPECGFCANRRETGTSCSNCGWFKIFGECGKKDSGWRNLWETIINANRLAEGILTKINTHLESLS